MTPLKLIAKRDGIELSRYQCIERLILVTLLAFKTSRCLSIKMPFVVMEISGT
jgi:hypothetical protein